MLDLLTRYENIFKLGVKIIRDQLTVLQVCDVSLSQVVGTTEATSRLWLFWFFSGHFSSNVAPHLHAEDSFGVSLQRTQQQAALGVAYADGAVIGTNQQHSACALLRCGQAAHSSWAVALEHIQLLHSLAS